MASWGEFAAAEPLLASAVRALVCQYGQGLGYLATVRADGGPRVHPVSPVITDDGLFCFIIDSPKRCDLDRDGRYALHAFPPEESDDEAYLAGHAVPVTDRGRTVALTLATRADERVSWKLYEFTIEVAMVIQRAGPASARTVWCDPLVRPPRVRRNGPCAAAMDSVQ